MTQRFRNIRLIAWTLMLEAWRRREIYAIVFVTTVLIVGLRLIRFFEMEDLGKFYREISLKTMNVTTAATIILLAARQLPREFTNRTIYPLLAKPVSRLEFLLGKYLGVLMAGIFCYGLFMIVFTIGSVTLKAPIQTPLFLQSIYLQVLSFCVLASLVFLLSMMLNADAAITLSAVLFIASQILMNTMAQIYDYVPAASRAALLVLHFLVPQLTLFDASSKVVHSINVVVVDGVRVPEVVWGALAWNTIGSLTLYALVYSVLFLGGAYLFFRRRPL